MSSDPSRGFLYVAFGESHLDEAAVAITMLLRHNLGANVCLVTTEAGKGYFTQAHARLTLDRIVCMSVAPNEPWCFFRTKLYDLSPYDWTLALDADTYVTSDLRHLFDLLDTFDFITVPDEAHPARGVVIGLKGGYAALSYYNPGVLLFRKSPASRQFFDNWKQEFLDLAPLEPGDQGPMTRALVKTPLRFITLPQEYNLRLSNKCASFMGRVKIIHGRARHPDKLIRMVNDIRLVNRGSRVWLPTLQRVMPATAFYVYGRLLKMLNLDEVQWAGSGRAQRTSIAGNVGDTLRSAWIRLRGAWVGREAPSASPPDPRVVDYLAQTYAVRSLLGCGRGTEACAAPLDGRSIEVRHLAHDWRSGPCRIDRRVDLVWCGEETRLIHARYVQALITTLTEAAARFLIVIYPRPRNGEPALSDLHEDWPWVQLITDRGFYFDPYLTLTLRGLAQDGDFKHAGLAFERVRRPQG